MNKSYERPIVTNEFADAPAFEQGTVIHPATWLAIFVVIAVAVLAWFVLSAGVPQVSAAADDESATPQIPYFPSQYTNQAGEPSPAPATF